MGNIGREWCVRPIKAKREEGKAGNRPCLPSSLDMRSKASLNLDFPVRQ